MSDISSEDSDFDYDDIPLTFDAPKIYDDDISNAPSIFASLNRTYDSSEWEPPPTTRGRSSSASTPPVFDLGPRKQLPQTPEHEEEPLPSSRQPNASPISALKLSKVPLSTSDGTDEPMQTSRVGRDSMPRGHMGTSSVQMSLPPPLDKSSRAGGGDAGRAGFSSPILEDDDEGSEGDVSHVAPPPPPPPTTRMVPPPLRQFDSEPAPLPRRSGGGGGSTRAAPLTSLPSLSRLRLPPPLQLDNPSSASPMAPPLADTTGITIPPSALTLSGLSVPPMGVIGVCEVFRMFL